jgi:hypothetical protein
MFAGESPAGLAEPFPALTVQAVPPAVDVHGSQAIWRATVAFSRMHRQVRIGMARMVGRLLDVDILSKKICVEL